MDVATLARHLETYLRPATFPVAIRLVPPGEAIPEKARRPKRDLHVEVAVCQAISMARRYGWTLAVGGEDLSCPIAKAAFGFEPRVPYYEKGGLAEGMYSACQEAAEALEGALPKLAEGEIQAVLAAPLAKATFEPETVLVYGNPAQVLRLVNAALYEKGGSFKAEFTGRGDCTDIAIRTRQTGQPQLILPCAGDRIFGLAADDEMAFTFPFSMAEAMVAGLEGTHKGGLRFPVPVFQRYQVEYPKNYQELERIWAEGRGAAAGEPKDGR